MLNKYLQDKLYFMVLLIAFFSTSSYGQFPSTIKLSDLDGSNGFVMNSSSDEPDHTCVSGLGDINGDGLDDFVVRADPAFVVFGNSTGFVSPFNLDSLNGMNGFVINSYANSIYGTSFSSAGDVNGDGLDDFIFDGSGRTNVVFGSNTGFPSPFDPNSLNGMNGFSFEYSSDSVSEAGDVNGDGIDDIVFGNYSAMQTIVVFGSSGGFPSSFDLSNLNGTNGFLINGPDNFGFTVGGSSDINGDNIDDLIIGAEDDTYVVFGSSGGFPSSFDVNSLDGSNGFKIDLPGRYVSGAGDVNGDGLDDMILGVIYEYFVLFGSSGGFPANLFNLYHADFDEVSSVSCAGDVNGDGLDDIILGTYEASNGKGKSFVVFGNSTDFTSFFPLESLNGRNGFTVRGINGSWSGWSVSGAGDVNGDGVDDLIIAARLAGQSYVIYGRPIPSNNNCLDAIALSCVSNLIGESTAGSTAIDPATGCSLGTGIWYTYSATTSETVTLEITNPTFDYSFGVASSTDCTTFNTVKCTSQESNGDRAYAFNAAAGTDYYIFIGDGDVNGVGAGTFNISLSCAPTPANNLCSTATPLSCGSPLLGETSAGGIDNGNMTGCFPGVGVWYSYTSAVDGSASLIVSPDATYRPRISVSTSTNCSTANNPLFTNILCGTGSTGAQQTLSFPIVNGQTYYIYIGDHNNVGVNTGNFDIELECCADDYAGLNKLTGTQTVTMDFESDGPIESEQLLNVNGTQVDYNSAIMIELLKNFSVTKGTVFQAFIDGCGGSR